MPQTPTRHPAETWPPTQLRLSPSMEDASLANIEMPLTYFLSSSHDPDASLIDLSAGIQDAPKQKLALGDLTASNLFRRRYGESRGSMSSLSEGSDSDDEDYVRFPPGGMEVRRPETQRSTRKGKSKGKKLAVARDSAPTLSARNRGGTSKRDGGDGRQEKSQVMDSKRRAWREPSPYVWSIEEVEEDGVSDRVKRGRKKSVSGGRSLAVTVLQQEEPLDENEVEARLMRRKVRFVLPAKE